MKKIISCILMLSVLSCGSSSGGGSSSDTGSLSIAVVPNIVTVGTIAFVSLRFSDIAFDDFDTEGLTVKFVLPQEIRFVTGSAVLILNNGALEIAPIFSGAVEATDDDTIEQLAGDNANFLVFTVTPSQLDDDNKGTIEFTIRALDREPNASIQADLDRGVISDFDVTNPGFDAETTANIEIVNAP